MLDARMLSLQRATQAVTFALAAPMVVAGGLAGEWSAVAPFMVAMLCALGAPHLVQGPQAVRFITAMWPLWLWPLLYSGAVDIVQQYPHRYVDHLLAQADLILLQGRSPDTWELGGPQEELANLIYVSYYLVIPGGALWAWWRFGLEQASRYTLSILTSFTACALLWLIFPAGGYHPDGSPDGHPFGPFTALMRAIYEASPHFAAAFPSSHVALSFASAAALARLGVSPVIWLWATGVAWSTVQGQYHYLVDSPPAVALGIGAAWWAMRTEGVQARTLPASLRQLWAWREPS